MNDTTKPALRGPSVARRTQRLLEATSWIELDLPAVDHNAAQIRRLLDAGDARRQREQRTKLCAVVKKNAYGCGAVAIASRLAKSGMVDMLAVFNHEEALELINAGIDLPIMMMMPFARLGRTDGLYRHAVSNKLHITVHDRDQVEALKTITRELGMRMPLHLHMDTGMCRGGLSPDALQAILQGPQRQLLQVDAVYTHLSAADDDMAFTQAQVNQLSQLTEQWRSSGLIKQGVQLHAANSSATLRNPDWHLDMVRMGLAFHGYGPEGLAKGGARFDQEQQLELHPFMAWKSHIIHASRFPAGSSVGYNGTHRLLQETALGVVPVGYGDGYPLSLSNKGLVRVWREDGTHQDCRVLGKVNMDQIVIDLSPLAGSGSVDHLRGAEVDLISADPTAPNALPAMAEAAGLNIYALLCGLNPRIPRHQLYH